MKKIIVILLTICMIGALVALSACGSDSSTDSTQSTKSTSVTGAVTTSVDPSEIFSERDQEQDADLSDSTAYTVSDGQNITITAAGTYVITGTAKNATIIVEADKEDKVQLVLDGVSITNTSAPAIYVKSADKVFVTTEDGTENTLSVTGTFTADGDTNTDAVIFSKDDLVLNGQGTLTISSTDNGISGKDDIKITGGTINITCTSDAIEANDSIAVSDGVITINSRKDGLHAENDEDDTVGWIYISGGTFNITASSDGIQGTTTVQIDGGAIDITASEGIEGTYVQINDGTITINASDDGINASYKSSAYTPTIEINGGTVTVNMGQGDTDGIDSNGNIYINGGTVSVNANSPFDYDGVAEHNGGTVIVNGTETDSITNQFGGMGGMQPGGQGGMQPGGYGPGGR